MCVLGRKPLRLRPGLGGREQDTYVPGHTISDYRPYNAARLIPANTDIYLNLHYTPNGTPIRTHVKIGFTVAKDPPKHQVLMVMVSGATDRSISAFRPMMKTGRPR